MANVWPMQPLGAAQDAPDLLTYVTRDTIGVEDPGALPADWTGWNEGAEWTGRVESAFENEHDQYGLHKTLKVARGILWAWYAKETDLYTVFDESYLQDSNGNTIRGANAFSVLKLG